MYVCLYVWYRYKKTSELTYHCGGVLGGSAQKGGERREKGASYQIDQDIGRKAISHPTPRCHHGHGDYQGWLAISPQLAPSPVFSSPPPPLPPPPRFPPIFFFFLFLLLLLLLLLLCSLFLKWYFLCLFLVPSRSWLVFVCPCRWRWWRF